MFNTDLPYKVAKLAVPSRENFQRYINDFSEYLHTCATVCVRWHWNTCGRYPVIRPNMGKGFFRQMVGKRLRRRKIDVDVGARLGDLLRGLRYFAIIDEDIRQDFRHIDPNVNTFGENGACKNSSAGKHRVPGSGRNDLHVPDCDVPEDLWLWSLSREDSIYVERRVQRRRNGDVGISQRDVVGYEYGNRR